MKIMFNGLMAIVLSALFVVSCKDDETQDFSPNVTDRAFLVQAANSDNAEISFGQLAINTSTNDTIRAFAQTMVTDHANTLAGLDSLSDQYSIGIPSSLDSLHMALRLQLEALSGYDFDTAYINGQVRQHQNAVALFQNEVTNGNAPNIKSFAARVLPRLRMHLEMADSIAGGL